MKTYYQKIRENIETRLYHISITTNTPLREIQYNYACRVNNLSNTKEYMIGDNYAKLMVNAYLGVKKQYEEKNEK